MQADSGARICVHQPAGYNHVWTIYWDDVNTKGKWSWKYEVFLDRKRVRR